jgi:ESCRT-I complex subunit VPS37
MHSSANFPFSILDRIPSIDDSTYDTVFQTVSGVALILRVHMPLPNSSSTGGSCQPPAMTLAGVRARHDWLDARMRITGYAAIATADSWRESCLLLGPAVHHVVTHLQLHPPEILQVTDSGLQSIQPSRQQQKQQQQAAASHSSSSRAAAAAPPADVLMDAPPDYTTLLEQPPAPPEIEMPPIPSEFEQLESLTRDELEELLSDELELLAFMNRLPVTDQIRSMAGSMVEENATMAQTHLEQEAELKGLHAETVALQKELQSKVKAFQVLEKKQNALCAPPDQRQIVRDLQVAKKQAMDESEQIADDWLEEGGSVDEFLRGFLAKRKEHHTRAAKLEILQHN